jgi:predicted transcriptional regulator
MKKKQNGHRAAVVKYWRSRGFKTQKELADDFGLHESTVSRYLSGERGLSIRAALVVSEKIGLPFESFFK